MTAIEAIRTAISRGLITLNERGEFWRIATSDRHGKVTSKTPKRAECKLKRGYLGIKVCIGGKQYLMQAHRAVWELTKGPIPSGLEPNHVDGNKHNNSPNNLELLTRGRNHEHAYATGLRKPPITPIVADLSSRAKKLRAQNMTFSEIAKALGVSQTTAFRAVQHESGPS
ncbi:HNH endonuclease [Burkholderia ubonensis]|uniref:HNH endonuclease n=1 Tax=Burkholderia ubonensis TaxID=101571 RepID=UPI0012FA1EE3